MKYSLFAALFLLLTSFISPVTQAFAQGGQTLEQAVQSVKHKTGGRILSTKTVNKNGKRVHKIKVLLPSGKVQVLRVDAN